MDATAPLAIGSGAGQVSVSASAEATFTVTAQSRNGNTFQITRTPAGGLVRACTTRGQAACRADGSW